MKICRFFRSISIYWYDFTRLLKKIILVLLANCWLLIPVLLLLNIRMQLHHFASISILHLSNRFCWRNRHYLFVRSRRGSRDGIHIDWWLHFLRFPVILRNRESSRISRNFCCRHWCVNWCTCSNFGSRSIGCRIDLGPLFELCTRKDRLDSCLRDSYLHRCLQMLWK